MYGSSNLAYLYYVHCYEIVSYNKIQFRLVIELSVALLTILERKLLASLQRRVGPDTVGIFGILQPIADDVKLVTKQTSSTANSQRFIFYVAPAYAFILVIFC